MKEDTILGELWAAVVMLTYLLGLVLYWLMKQTLIFLIMWGIVVLMGFLFCTPEEKSDLFLGAACVAFIPYLIILIYQISDMRE